MIKEDIEKIVDSYINLSTRDAILMVLGTSCDKPLMHLVDIVLTCTKITELQLITEILKMLGDGTLHLTNINIQIGDTEESIIVVTKGKI